MLYIAIIFAMKHALTRNFNTFVVLSDCLVYEIFYELLTVTNRTPRKYNRIFIAIVAFLLA